MLQTADDWACVAVDVRGGNVPLATTFPKKRRRSAGRRAPSCAPQTSRPLATRPSRDPSHGAGDVQASDYAFVSLPTRNQRRTIVYPVARGFMLTALLVIAVIIVLATLMYYAPDLIGWLLAIACGVVAVVVRAPLAIALLIPMSVFANAGRAGGRCPGDRCVAALATAVSELTQTQHPIRRH